ncbi:hypothetical protein HNQ94_001996 [Salirhabdus euzebyi]|uniref:Lipoprotein n=1 Tax=Salirhabdus euzebyi TaxID=394506 RepID=A0A841Q5A6_9BACI|nr:DUF6376 family protein [Salirhabdus euzebyi]MBB6453547.1 hypothetical protein [Salirhabdus euzebyi]
MKKMIALLSMIFILSGCSILGEVNNSVNYVGEATDYLTYLNNFAEETPQMIQQAATDAVVMDNLVDKFNELKAEIMAFNILDAPALAEDIHQNLVEKNELILTEINNVLENGQVAVDKIENSPIFSTINDATNLMNQIENLGL